LGAHVVETRGREERRKVVLGDVTGVLAGRRAVSSTLLFGAACGLLMIAWLVGNPLGRAPDEPMHYVKAAALANGEPRGGATTLTHAGYTEKQWQWARQQVRLFNVPPRIALAPVVPCPIFDPRVPARCQQGWPTTDGAQLPSYLGTYQPYAYVPSAALMRLAPSPTWAYYLGRAGVAVTSLGLVVLGVAALWTPRPPPASVGGVLLALTPTAVFLASTLNVNGIEIMAGFCFTCGVLALGRRRAGGRSGVAWAWTATAAGGVALAGTRSLGPYFLVAVAACLLVDAGAPGVVRAVRDSPRVAAGVAAAIGGAAALNVWWEHAFQPHLQVQVGKVISHPTFAGIPHIAKQLVGGIGWLEFQLPLPIYVAWGVLTLALVVGGLIAGRARERAALATLVAGSFVVLVALHTVLGKQIEFDVQGRDLLPLAIAIPLLAGEVLRRHPSPAADRITRGLLVPTAVAVAVTQLAAWYFNARRHAVGTHGPLWFFASAEWAPPGGWGLWSVLAALGAAGMGAAVVTALRTSRHRGDRTVPAPTPPRVDALEGIA
ncbi:MAG: DUF2142 domain-containing protein, partial [Acidimicrobiia bacterium]|nr:DUF2142 domain-containing protein [Acidimicrobiia bacterium]